MSLVTIDKEFTILDPIQYTSMEVNSKSYYFSLNSLIGSSYLLNSKNSGFSKVIRKSIYNSIFLKNFNSPHRHLSKYNTSINISSLDNDGLINLIESNTNDTVKSISFKFHSSNLETDYQAYWYLLNNYNFSFALNEFIKDDKYLVFNSTSINGDDNTKIDIYYIEDCDETISDYLTNTYQYVASTKTLLIDGDTYLYDSKNCDYSDIQIDAICVYNKQRKFEFNQDVNGKDSTVTAGTLIDVTDIYPSQLTWSDLVDRCFNVVDSDSNTQTLTVKDYDNDNNKISFKEDINYNITNSTQSISNDDANQGDKDNMDVYINKNIGSIQMDYDPELLTYVDYINTDDIEKCFITNDTSIITKKDVSIYGILTFKSDGIVDTNYTVYNNNILLFDGVHTKQLLNEDQLLTLLGGHLVNPYVDTPELNKYLFYFFETLFIKDNSTSYFKVFRDSSNKIEWSFDISKNTDSTSSDVGFYFNLLTDNNFEILKVDTDTTTRYTISNIVTNYTLDNKTFEFKAKTNKNMIVLPLIYELINKLTLNEYTNLLNYSIKYIIRLKENNTWLLNYNFNAELFNKMLHKYIKDTDEFKS